MNITLAECQMKFAELVWENAPIHSTELVKLAEEKLKWNKSTSYTVLRILCGKGLLQNKGCIVTCLLTKEQFKAAQTTKVISDCYDGSIPAFLNAFAAGEKISKKDAEEILRMIDEYEQNE